MKNQYLKRLCSLLICFAILTPCLQGVQATTEVTNFDTLFRQNLAVNSAPDMVEKVPCNPGQLHKISQLYRDNPDSIEHRRLETYSRYYVHDFDYLEQYINQGNLHILFDDCQWITPLTIAGKTLYGSACYLDEDGVWKPTGLSERYLLDVPYSLFEDSSKIQSELLDRGIFSVDDVKVVRMAEIYMVYIRSGAKEYGFVTNYYDPTDKIKENSLYTISELFDAADKERDLRRGQKEKGDYTSEADALNKAGLFKGSDTGYNLYSRFTRLEAITMIVRLLGQEKQALNANYSINAFDDVPRGHWGEPYANFAFEKGITQGTGERRFSPDSYIPVREFLTLLLRSMGYAEAMPDNAVSICANIGMFDTDIDFYYDNIMPYKISSYEELFTRGDMVHIVTLALNTKTS